MCHTAFYLTGIITITTAAPINNADGAISISNNDVSNLDIETSVPSSGHKSMENMSMDEQTEAIYNQFTLRNAAEFLERYGYESRDWKEHSAESLEGFLYPSLKLFQRRMNIQRTGKSQVIVKNLTV